MKAIAEKSLVQQLQEKTQEYITIKNAGKDEQSSHI